MKNKCSLLIYKNEIKYFCSKYYTILCVKGMAHDASLSMYRDSK